MDSTDTSTDDLESQEDRPPHAEVGDVDRRTSESADVSSGSSTFGNGPSLERRDYLRSAGAVGVFGALAGFGGLGNGATGTARAQSDWEVAADERIAQHRTGSLEIIVETEDGEPIPGADVEVEMQAHDYGFGTAVNAEILTDETHWGEQLDSEAVERYREYIPDLFNMAVFGNYHKWRFWEENQEQADAAVEWVLEQGLDLRGHTCLWGATQHNAVPTDVEQAIDDGDGETVRERSLEHLETIISHYGDDIVEWDVVNEVLHEPALIEAVDGDDVDPVEAPVLAEWYERAQEVAADEGVQLAVNDFNTLVGPHDYARQDYQRQIEFLLEEGIDLDGIGMQCHFSVRGEDDDERLTSEEILAGLDTYAEYGLELRATEFDTFDGDGWESDQAKAAYLSQFLKTFFSHPATEDFLMWGFWDVDHWGDDAPLFEADWTAKPAYDEYVGLVFDEWWTEETGETDEDGAYETTVFLGEHELAVTTDNRLTRTTVSVTDSEATTTVTVTADSDEDQDQPPIDGHVPQDTTGDGLANDFTGNGETGTTDINVFFENIDNPDVTDYSDHYDFTGNGEVSLSDVIELFESI